LDKNRGGVALTRGSQNTLQKARVKKKDASEEPHPIPAKKGKKADYISGKASPVNRPGKKMYAAERGTYFF